LRPVLDDLGRLLHGMLCRLGLPDPVLSGAPGRRLDQALALAWPGLAPAQFYGQKVAVAAAAGALLPVLNAADLAPWGPWPVWSWVLGLLAGYFAPDLALARRLARRRADVLEELPGLVDLLSLATSAGMALEQALRLVAEQTQGVVAREVQQATREAALGQRTLVASLEAMAERNGVEALSALVGRLRAAHDQGLPLAETLATQAESMRERRRLTLLEAGGRASVHMVLPVALLIFPVTFVVLLAPAVVAVLSLAR
jgi:tight adherence protein C